MQQSQETPQNLQEPLANLQQCQTSKNLDSCLKCDQILQCEVRNTYVKAVYQSLNSEGGSFEF